MNLTSENVEKVFLACLTETKTGKEVEGILHKFQFDESSLEKFKESIITMLSDLPPEFQSSGEGGWSFLNLCTDKYGNQWTGLHEIMEKLVVLGIAIDKVSFLFPKELWEILPGQMPYIVVKD